EISIAIIGAGITSLALAHGLLQHPHIKLRIYEARPKLGEDGTGVGIGANGQNALSLISPQLRQSLDDAGAVKCVPSLRLMLAAGSYAGTLVKEMDYDPPQATVVRSRWVFEMVKAVPEGVVQTGKRLAGIEEVASSGKVRMTFEDGGEELVDGLIGCDGINSYVRSYVFPSAEGIWSTGFNTRMMIPITEGRAIFGDEYCAKQVQTGWVGDAGFCMTDFEDGGDLMQVIAGFQTDEHIPELLGKAYAEVPKSLFLDPLQSWGWIGERISEVIRRQEKMFAGARRVSPIATTYVRGKVCVSGDAARAFSPARGAGASAGIEDALALSALLGEARRPADVGKAFALYDKLRRPRRDEVAEASLDAGRIITGTHPDAGTDLEKLRAKVADWNGFIYRYDLKG
ncbi:hypothetical protein BDY17DRAFT_237471, partial [Neohortaea acidophila]